MQTLTPFFSPRGVAIVGASNDPTKLGYGLARNLALSGYPGAIYFINPRGGSLFGRPVYPDLASVPDPVDLAVLLVPAPAIPEALRSCANRGLKAAVIGAGGFRETGPAGAALEEECRRLAHQAGIRLIGPNSIGLLDTHLPLNLTFLPPPGPLPGEVAFISHSGAICLAAIEWAHGQGFGLSRLVSLGNQADINEADVLAPVAADPFTQVIVMYLEGVQDGQRFIAEAGRVSRTKPIIALKAGRFSSGQRAVASHTGALAGSENAFNTAFRRAGVIRAESIQEIFDWARALAWCPLPHGRNVAVLTNAGGLGVTAADAVESNGLRLAELESHTRQALAKILPAAASVHNPVDMLASASPEQYAACLRLLLDDQQVDSILVIIPPPPMYTAGAVAKNLIPIIHTAEKPVIIALVGERLIQEAVEHFRAARVPEYRFPERAASALGILSVRAEYLQNAARTAASQPPALAGIDHQTVKMLLQAQADPGDADCPEPDGQLLPAELANRILNAYGVPIPPAVLVNSPQAAAAEAAKIGFPVALKIASLDISHKSDVGGIMLNLQDAAQVEQGFRQVVENARTALPTADIQGVVVQRMIPSGQEVIVGAVRDAQFGSLTMFGSGGVEVEGLKDISFGLAPLSTEEANAMLDNCWAGRKLSGFRNLPPADREAVLQALRRVAQLAADFPQLAEIEINPLCVLPKGQGAYAIDVRIVLKT